MDSGHFKSISPYYRQFAAAAAGGSGRTGKKHPGKAILAGKYILCLYISHSLSTIHCKEMKFNSFKYTMLLNYLMLK